MIVSRMPRVFHLALPKRHAHLASNWTKRLPDHEAKPSSKKAAIEKMLTERGSPADFDKAVATAEKARPPPSRHCLKPLPLPSRPPDDDKAGELLPKFLERNEKFDVADSEIFAVKEDWQAVVEYLQALCRTQEGRPDGFKKHITEAFWPQSGQGFRFSLLTSTACRLNDSMKK